MILRALRTFSVLTVPVTLGIISANVAIADDYAAGKPLVDTVVVDAKQSDVQTLPAPDSGTKEQAAPATVEPQTVATAPCCCHQSPCCCTKKKKEAATAKMKGAYKGVFYANDFSYLDDPCYSGDPQCGDSFKGLMGGKMDIGGEVRMRYHNEEGHRGLGLTGVDDQFWLHRTRLFSNYRMNDYFRFYGEFIYADSGGQTFNPRPIEVDRGDINNLFFDANLISGPNGSLKARVGRQELLFGAQRLVSPLDWGNTRRTFQGGRLMYSGDNWDVDGFFVNPVTNEFNDLDEAVEDVDFFGVYGTRKGLDIGSVEAYYLGLVNDIAGFDYHTIGSRVAGSTNNFMYDIEGGFQFGTNANDSDHGAEFFTGGLGKKFSFCTCHGEWNPIFWAWYDYASGGDENFVNRGDDSFDHLFPLAHKYNGLMDLFGRRNLHDINFQFITPLGKKAKLLVWYHHFILDEATTPYSVVMTPFNTAALAGDKELGSEIDLALSLTLSPRDSVLLGYSHFAAGDYYRTTAAGIPTDDDAQFFYAQFQKRF